MTNPAHTLASETGFRRFVLILNAQEAWRGMTKNQRAAVIARLHEPVAPQTLAALARRQIAEDGVMTEWGEVVRAVNYKDGDGRT